MRRIGLWGFLACGLAACSAAAPPAPLGFNKRPANADEAAAHARPSPGAGPDRANRPQRRASEDNHG